MNNVQTSESIKIGILLALSGGFLDAYSYINRGGVFANAATGNIVLFSISLGELNLMKALYYLVPIVAFASGVLISNLVKYKRKDRISSFHWRQIAIIIEIVSVIAVAFIPQSLNLPVNSLISLTCGLQVTTFSKIRGRKMATTMCTGNLRNGTENLSLYFTTRERNYIRNSLAYFSCIFCFVIGAIIGGVCSKVFHERATIFVALGLVIVFFMMFFNNEKRSLED